jgi:CHAD domain-containing protein
MATKRDCQLIAAKYLRRQTKQLAEQLDGARIAEDVEFVHRARVAMRRLRVALRLFKKCFSRSQRRRWEKAIRRIATQLGRARDRDVQIVYLHDVLAAGQAKESLPGISRVLVHRERDRERLQKNVVKAIDSFETSGVLLEIQRFTKRRLRRLDRSTSFKPSVKTCKKMAEQIFRRCDELLEYRDSLNDPENHEQHHAMRIAAKHLRYTLEIAKTVYPEQLHEVFEAVKKVQSFLGEIHDCDIWQDDLEQFAREERRWITNHVGHVGRFARLQSGIDWLRQDRLRHRHAIFEQVVAFWNELSDRRFWDQLPHVIWDVCSRPTSSVVPKTTAGAANGTPSLDHLTLD